MRGGGNPFKVDHNVETMLGKDIVFYRAIEGLPAEIVGQIRAPDNIEHLRDFYKYSFQKMEDFYEKASDLIPDVQEMTRILKVATGADDETMRVFRRFNSYNVHSAIYDYKKNKIVTMHALIPDCLYDETFCTDREPDARRAIFALYGIEEKPKAPKAPKAHQ